METFALRRSALSLTEVAEENNVSMGTAHRYVSTLKKFGYLTQDPETKKYQLTFKVLDLGFSFLANMDFRTRVLQHMVQATRQLDVTSQCAILDGPEIVYIERIRSKDVINLDLSAGSRLPAHSTSMGKAMLAFLKDEERENILACMDLTPLTPYTITDRETLLKELEITRERGYATNNEELNMGLQTLGAPVFKDGKVEGALGFSFPSHRMQGDDFKEILTGRLLDIASKVSIGPMPRGVRW